MAVEEPKKSIPGVRECILEIRALSDKISAIEDEVKECKEKIQAILEENMAKSEKARLSNDLKAISEALRELKQERRGYYDILNATKSEIDSLKESTEKLKEGGDFRSVEDVKKRMEILENRLLTARITPADERNIATEMQGLRYKVSQFADVEGNLKKQRQLEEKYKDMRGKISVVSGQITSKTSDRDAIKVVLNKLYESKNVKIPVVERLEITIGDLKNKKQDLIKAKEEKRAEIDRLKAEFEAFEKQLEEQRKLEEKKEAIRKVISSISEKKEKLLESATASDPSNLDIIIYDLSSLRLAEPFTVSLDLVSSLLKNGVEIPAVPSDVDGVIRELENRKKNGKAKYMERMQKINAEVSKLDEEIKSEKSKLEKMPPTNHDILRKGSYRGVNRGRA